ncbi:MAG: GAF domain-containing protein [Phycisphaerales bacterium JB064]
MSASTSASTNPSLPGRSSPGGAQGASGGGALAGGDPQQALTAYLSGLLERLCTLSRGQAGAAFIRGSQHREGGLAAVHVAPGHERLAEQLRGDAQLLARLSKLAERAAEQAQNGTVQPITESVMIGSGALYHAQATHRATAVPLVALGQAEGACVVLTPAGENGNALAERSMLVAAEGFEGFLWSQRAMAEAERTARLRETLEMLDAAQRGSSAQTMASLFCDELRRRFGCSRVTVGLVNGQDIKAVAISGADTIDRRNPAVEALEAAMDECADQDIEVLFPQSDDLAPAERRVVRAHGELSRSFGPSSIVSLPLRVDGDLVGVALLERDADDPFPPGSLGLLRLVAEFIGPAVWTRRLADRGILAVTRDRAMDLGAAIVGPRHTLAKLIALIAILVFVALAVTPIPAVVTADAEAKAHSLRAVTPPYQGYLAWVGVKPGDAVEAGQVIAKMDTTEREAQLAQLDARYAAQRTTRETELSRGRMDQAEVAEQQMAEIEAQRKLLRYEIERASLRAPIDGRVSGSDLEPWLDAAIAPDTPLMKIVGENSVVVLRIPERDIAAAQRRLSEDDADATDGTFAPRARPDERLPLRLVRVNPQAEAVAGGNVYMVEAEITGPAPQWLRPGMTGRARVRSGWTTPLVRLARPLIDRAQMAWWW